MKEEIVSQTCASIGSVHPPNLCILSTLSEQVRLLAHSSMAEVVSILPKAGELRQLCTTQAISELCLAKAAPHGAGIHSDTRHAWAIFSNNMTCLSLLLCIQNFCLIFFPRENNATTQFQSILDIVSDSLQLKVPA